MEDNNKTEKPIDELQQLTEVLPTAISLFTRLSHENRQKLLASLATIFDLSGNIRGVDIEGNAPSQAQERKGHFSEDRSISAKDFMLQKQPRTDVERVACLAYYLTHYRDVPYFRTLDISKVNTEAAQMKFSNAAKAVDNATMYGYLAPATKGNKQLSAGGELFVRALPDRDAAKSAMATARPRRRLKKTGPRENAEAETQQDADFT